MIVLSLSCMAGHHFDGWFASLDAFEQQARQELINCPQCNGTAIQRLPSGPHISKRAATGGSTTKGNLDRLVDSLQRAADLSEDVGDQFSDEARRIHRRESAERPIRGLATLDEFSELLEEGIPVLPVPGKKTSH
ncbi:MAG TPA: DUF1178 family protein [Rhodocyclaceae bacterium]|nr:DUF1178 family protein [Rhodocyclaceae bacterium]